MMASDSGVGFPPLAISQKYTASIKSPITKLMSLFKCLTFAIFIKFKYILLIFLLVLRADNRSMLPESISFHLVLHPYFCWHNGYENFLRCKYKSEKFLLDVLSAILSTVLQNW